MVVSEILRHLRQRKAGKSVSESEWHKFKLRRSEYNDFLNLLKNEESLWGFVEDKVKYKHELLVRL